MADMDINERRFPQNGRIHASIDGREYDFRVTTMPAVFGESVIARILDQSSVLIGLDRLGLTEQCAPPSRSASPCPRGCSWSLARPVPGARRRRTRAEPLNSPQRKVVTIEDPVEYPLRGMMQVHVNRKAGLPPAGALRSFMRCDPDVVMVGELRDAETAVMCRAGGHDGAPGAHHFALDRAARRSRD